MKARGEGDNRRQDAGIYQGPEGYSLRQLEEKLCWEWMMVRMGTPNGSTFSEEELVALYFTDLLFSC